MSADNPTAAWTAQPLDWDSTFWGCRVARITAPGSGERIAFDADLLAGCDFAYLLAPPADTEVIGMAEENGFRVVDVRCEVSLAPDRPTDEALDDEISPARGQDLQAVEALAAKSHFNTRFGNDRLLDRELVAELYRRWIRRDAERPGWSILVALVDAEVAGYVTHGPDSDGLGSIGLIAVDPSRRGAGLGRRLLTAAALAEQRARRGGMRGVTQGGSVAAMTMYQRAGFTVDTLGIWLHWHRR